MRDLRLFGRYVDWDGDLAEAQKGPALLAGRRPEKGGRPLHPRSASQATYRPIRVGIGSDILRPSTWPRPLHGSPVPLLSISPSNRRSAGRNPIINDAACPRRLLLSLIGPCILPGGSEACPERPVVRCAWVIVSTRAHFDQSTTDDFFCLARD